MSASARFSRIVRLPQVPIFGSWSTLPIFRARSYSFESTIFSPLNTTAPESGWIPPQTIFSMVVLPLPLEPTTEIKSPSLTSSVKLSNSLLSSTVPRLNTFVILLSASLLSDFTGSGFLPREVMSFLSSLPPSTSATRNISAFIRLLKSVGIPRESTIW